MTQSYTTTETWSRTHARYVAGKVAADLRQFQQEYGEPSDLRIDQYLEELTTLLTGGYVQEVTYGYHKGGTWVAGLRYTADMHGNLTADDRSGKIPRGADISDATFYSFMTFSSKWSNLSRAAQEAIEKTLPFVRSSGVAPTTVGGTADKVYASAGCGLRRTSVGGVF